MAKSLRPLEAFPITVRRLEVLRAVDITPGMRRVTLGGPGLAAHTAENGKPVHAFRSEGFDDEFKIFMTHPELDEPLVPRQGDGALHWPRDPMCLPRTYTVRRWDPRAGELDVDFVQHGVGPATAWARSAKPGDPLWIAGPKSSAGHPQGVDWTLVAGDETALPAIGHWLERWPAGQRGQVFIEVAQASHIQDLPRPDGVEVTWLTRDGAEAGTTTLLLDALKAAQWWEGRVFAWVAGEALTLVPIRRWLRGDKGLDRSQVEVTGYWRRQEVVADETAESGIDLNATRDTFLAFHEMCEMTPGIAVRVAATIGLGQALEEGPRTREELVEATGAHAVGLTKLLRYLAAIGLVTIEPGEPGEPGRPGAGEQGARYGLTDLGRELQDDEMAELLSLDGPHGRRDLGALVSLLAAVRTGTGDYASWFGQGYQDRLDGEPGLQRPLMEDDAEMAQYITGALAAVPALAGREHVTVAGRAAGAVAHALVEADPQRRATVVGRPSQVGIMREIHPDHERVRYEAGSLLAPRAHPADAVLLVQALESWPDADCVQVLTEAGRCLNPGGTVLVLTSILDITDLDDHECEDDLTAFALGGGGLRTGQEMRALFEAAGLSEPASTTVGWGYALLAAAPQP